MESPQSDDAVDPVGELAKLTSDHAREKDSPPLHQVSQDQIAKLKAGQFVHQLRVDASGENGRMSATAMYQLADLLEALLVEDRPPMTEEEKEKA